MSYEILSFQLIERLNLNRGMDHQADERVVRTWAEAIGYDVVNVVQKSQEGSRPEIIVLPPPRIKPQFESNAKAPQMRNEASKTPTPIGEEQSEKNNIPTMIWVILGGGVLIVVYIFVITGVSSPPETTMTSSHIQGSSTPLPPLLYQRLTQQRFLHL